MEEDHNIDGFLQKRYPRLFKRLDRLHGITGFISILGSDPRVKVFNRYYHIQRVVRLAKWFLDLNGRFDKQKSLFLAHFHDLNRLPFAHNLERKIGFKQAENLEPFIRLSGEHVEREYIDDLKSVINKEIDGSAEAELIYMLDAVVGFMEDPLFAVVIQKVGTESLPAHILDKLGLRFNDARLKRKTERLQELFHNNPGKFIIEFNDAVFKYSTNFIFRNSERDGLSIGTDRFLALENLIKEDLLKRIIFPINNEVISKGSRIADEIALPYISHLKMNGIEPIKKLWEMTDQDLLNEAIGLGLTRYKPEEYYPDII